MSQDPLLFLGPLPRVQGSHEGVCFDDLRFSGRPSGADFAAEIEHKTRSPQSGSKLCKVRGVILARPQRDGEEGVRKPLSAGQHSVEPIRLQLLAADSEVRPLRAFGVWAVW